MYCLDNRQRSYKPQTKHAERMILPGSSQKYLQMYLWVHGSWETDCRKSQISSSFFLISHAQHCLQTKAVIELLHAQNDMAFVIVTPSARLSASWQKWRFWLVAVLRSSKTMPFWATYKVMVQTYAYCACMHSSHANTLYHSLLMMVVFEVLTKS